MFDSVESDATLLLDDFQSPQGKIADSLSLIENTLEWYDHISCAFLLYDDPHEALEKISTLRESYNNKTQWRQIVLTPLFQPENLKSSHSSNLSEKLGEVLFLVKHYGLLNMLEMAVNSTANIDPLRLKLFEMIDQMGEEQATLWAEQMSSEKGFPRNDSSWCLEMHCLRWIEEGKLSKEQEGPLRRDRGRDGGGNRNQNSGCLGKRRKWVPRTIGRYLIKNYFLSTGFSPLNLNSQNCSKNSP